MPQICRKRQKQASNGFEEEETYKLAQLLNESEMTSQHLGSLSSNMMVTGSNLKLDVVRCRSLESLMGRVGVVEYPQEIVLVQLNLKLRERLRYLCRCKDISNTKQCNERQCPNILQRLEKHRLRCPGSKKTFCKSASFKKEEVKNVPTKIFMYDKGMQTADVKKINDASTCWEHTEQKQTTTSPLTSMINDCKKICNSASTMATADCMRKTRSTMAVTDILRHTQSCNTTVSFKNFYKDRLQYEVLQWLREVPIVAEFNSSTRVATEKTVNNLIEEIYRLSSKANCDTYENKLYALIERCIEALPVSYHSVKCDKTKRILIESLITRIMVLNNRYIFSPSDTSTNMPSFYPCGLSDFATYASMEDINEQPITKSYRKDINNWVQAKKFKRRDGKNINKTDVTERLLDRLFPLLYDKQSKDFKYLIRGGIIETLNNFALANGETNSRLYLDDLASDLTKILLRTRAAHKPSKKNSNVSSSLKNFFSNPKNFLGRLRRRKTVSIPVDTESTKDTLDDSKTFFRIEGTRRVTTASSGMTRCFSYYTSRKVSDLWFKLVKTDFPAIVLKLVIFKSLFMSLNLFKIVNDKERIQCDTFGSKNAVQKRFICKFITEELVLEAVKNYILMYCMVNEIIKQCKTHLFHGSTGELFESKLTAYDMRISKPYWSFETFNEVLVYN